MESIPRVGQRTGLSPTRTSLVAPIKDLPLVKDVNVHSGQTHAMARSAPRASSPRRLAWSH